MTKPWRDGPYRVVQWGTGNVGRRALAALLDLPQLTLVGLHVVTPEKVGKDAGELIGRPRIGVVAADDAQRILDIRPDCVSYMPTEIDYELVCRWLRAGINVVTTGDFLTGACRPHEHRLLDDAARSGGATFLGTGFEPGFVNLAAGFLTGACRRVRSVRIAETLDCTTYPVAAAWEAMGFGKPPEGGPVTLTPETTPFAKAYFETLDLVAGMLGVTLDHRELVIEQACATKDLDLGWAHYAQGTVAGQRRVYRGYTGGRPVVELSLCWTMSDHALEPQWTDPEGFRIEIEGEPRVEADVRYTVPHTDGLTDESDVMSLLMVSTAMSALHAIPAVCAAEPGVVLASDLPVLAARNSLC